MQTTTKKQLNKEIKKSDEELRAGHSNIIRRNFLFFKSINPIRIIRLRNELLKKRNNKRG